MSYLLNFSVIVISAILMSSCVPPPDRTVNVSKDDDAGFKKKEEKTLPDLSDSDDDDMGSDKKEESSSDPSKSDDDVDLEITIKGGTSSSGSATISGGAGGDSKIGLNLTESSGRLKVSSVSSGSPAANAGVQVGWFLDYFNGTKVSTMAQYNAAVSNLNPSLTSIWLTLSTAGGSDVSKQVKLK